MSDDWWTAEDAQQARQQDRMWIASDYVIGLARARGLDRDTLFTHRPHANHCWGYDVLAWPCLPAKEALDRVLGDQP